MRYWGSVSDHLGPSALINLISFDLNTQRSPVETELHCVSKNGHPLIFCGYSACCWPILKIFGNIAAKKICNNTLFKFYIDMWYLIVIQAENTPSAATVDIDITQQNPTLKLVTTQLEINAITVKYDQIRCSKSLPLAFTQAHQWKIWIPQRMLGNDVASFMREFGATRTTVRQAFQLQILTNNTVYRRVVNSCLF